MQYDPSKLILLKRKMARKDNKQIQSQAPPPIPPRRNSSSSLTTPRSTNINKQIPPPLPRRKSERINVKMETQQVKQIEEAPEIKLSPQPIDTKIKSKSNAMNSVVESDNNNGIDEAIDSGDKVTKESEENIINIHETTDKILQRKSFKKLVVKWSCITCKRECIPVREESRCLCGHRLKEHPSNAEDPRVKDTSKFKAFACTSARCACKSFFYIVAEGAWILRCRCKHKHIDHDPSNAPYHCKKPKCACSGFDSPWVCNCAHPWSEHVQTQEYKEFHPLDMDLCSELSKVYRTDLESEPLILQS
ncbi:hypothetical protein THRCLA_06799 [Thraustotheca clavata]|uniref:Protein FAM221A n=1 Tax=Thraustotheca clavata TaxID=74557 RepID=A0A1V9ZJ34_9STRA|nr:hypothetical protein THRCLA_06799 [Thraustotheca clavata]